MRNLLLILTLLLLASCQSDVPASDGTPTSIAFPTMTPGQVVRGALPTVVALPLDGGSQGNPATAIALANRPTATPNYQACPAVSEGVELVSSAPASSSEIDDTLLRFLNEGGSAQQLETTVRDSWGVLGDEGVVRGDFDLTGEGTAELILSYVDPDEGGALLIFSCADGRYVSRYQTAIGGENAPTILSSSDLNVDARPELLVSGEVCGESCQFITRLVTWDPERGRFINLLNGELASDEAPSVEDIDADRVSELVVRLTNAGDASTGPLRTGFTMYDWNGVVYTRSVTQLNPPRFRIQVVHQADAALAAGNTEEAIALYDLALNDPSLENWHNDDQAVLQPYIQYRLLLAYSDIEDPRRTELHASILQAYPDSATAPVYAELAKTFWNALQVTNNLHSACLEVQDIISTRQDALDFMNRYGSRSPTYTATSLCPF
jgi:hypothetical protein